MKPNLYVKAGLFVVLCLSFCSTSSAQSVNSADVQSVTNKFKNVILTRCGEYWYHRDLFDVLRRYREVSPPMIVARRLTPADRENGYQWRGWMMIQGETFQSFHDHGWGQVFDSRDAVFHEEGVYHDEIHNVLMEWELWNVRGHWFFQSVPGFSAEDGRTMDFSSETAMILPQDDYSGKQPQPYKSLSCSDIPGITTNK